MKSDHKELEKRMETHRERTGHVLLHILHLIERVIAIATIVVLVVALILELVELVKTGSYTDTSAYLHHILTIVVGLEFVRMLLDTTPANVLEVLTLAITRHVVLSHDDPLSNLACVACIAGMFAIRRFLIPREEMQEEMVENE